MARAVIYVPGFLSSELYSGDRGGTLEWVSKARLSVGALDPFALAADGVSPLPPHGKRLTAGPPLPDYWNQARDVLRVDLAARGWQLEDFGYDWRLDPRSSGPALAARIRAAATVAEPCALLCHSMGGIVARSAWADLVRTGETALVSQIVTAGTPHLGSYAPVRVVSTGDDMVEQMLTLCNVWYAGATAGSQGLPSFAVSRERLLRVVCSWPALFVLLPSVLSPDAESDPLRPKLYRAETWPAVLGVRQELLDLGGADYDQWQADPTTRPPGHVLTCVHGMGVPTPRNLVSLSNLGTPSEPLFYGDGDGQVTPVSAVMDDSLSVSLACRHADLIPMLAFHHLAANLLTATRPPSPTPPPPIAADVPFRPLLTGPPLPGGLGGATGRASCPGPKWCC